MERRTTTITLPEELILKARELGIEISKSCERALKRDIEAISTTTPDNSPPKTNPIKTPKPEYTRRRAGGWPTGASLRKLRPSGRTAGPKGPG